MITGLPKTRLFEQSTEAFERVQQQRQSAAGTAPLNQRRQRSHHGCPLGCVRALARECGWTAERLTDRRRSLHDSIARVVCYGQRFA